MKCIWVKNKHVIYMYGISVHNFRVLSHSTQALTQTQKHINSEKYELNISFSQKEKGKARIQY